ncbi:hypothetical protein DEJ50_27600 [Streptomyces venezuelae]|uniref:Uncharacterized protein n=1 Tax=Streptomyces venezuelae TaxID=54571 RepID=A0A5P2DA14_STRVZ|nr:hypothetical protein [Streptomyces venezuelae]QES51037.1 hypothetical protein DEJ50_27600 [Streptomyces venezuelae]
MREFELRVDDGTAGRAGRPPEDDLRSLLHWLNEDDGVRRETRGRVGGDGPPLPGHLGTGLDLLQLAVGSGLSTGSLVFAVLQWQASRRRPPVLTVRRGAYEVRLTGAEATDPEALRRIVAALETDGPAGTDGPAWTDRPDGNDDRTA